MESPWKENDDAFMPMFTESIVLTHQKQKQTISAAVFTDNTGDALADDNLDTDREDIQIVCKRKDWAYISKLTRGDVVERIEVNGLKYRISDVQQDALMGWCIYARSI